MVAVGYLRQQAEEQAARPCLALEAVAAVPTPIILGHTPEGRGVLRRVTRRAAGAQVFLALLAGLVPLETFWFVAQAVAVAV